MCQGMTESQIHTENEDEIVNSKNIDMGKKKKFHPIYCEFKHQFERRVYFLR